QEENFAPPAGIDGRPVISAAQWEPLRAILPRLFSSLLPEAEPSGRKALKTIRENLGMSEPSRDALAQADRRDVARHRPPQGLRPGRRALAPERGAALPACLPHVRRRRTGLLGGHGLPERDRMEGPGPVGGYRKDFRDGAG